MTFRSEVPLRWTQQISPLNYGKNLSDLDVSGYYWIWALNKLLKKPLKSCSQEDQICPLSGLGLIVLEQSLKIKIEHGFSLESVEGLRYKIRKGFFGWIIWFSRFYFKICNGSLFHFIIRFKFVLKENIRTFFRLILARVRFWNSLWWIWTNRQKCLVR